MLVIDDFLLTPTTENEQKYLMEVFELKSSHRSLILSSQIETGKWHKKLGGGAIADAILDRAISNSYHIYIYGDSLRMKTGTANTDQACTKNRDSPGTGNRDFVVLDERYMHHDASR